MVDIGESQGRYKEEVGAWQMGELESIFILWYP